MLTARSEEFTEVEWGVGDVVTFLWPCGLGCLWEICPISQNVNNSDSNGSSWLSRRFCAGAS